MSIYKRGRIWWVKIAVDGAPPLRESAGTEDRAAAREYHALRAAAIWRERRLGERPRIALAAAVADWVSIVAQHKKSYETDRVRLRVLLPYLPEYLDEVSTAAMTQMREKIRADRDIGASGTNKYLALLSAVLHHAHRRELLAAVPHVPMYRLPRRRRFVALTQQQASDLLDALPQHLRQVARFALATGLRDANARGMKWEDVDLTARVARVWPDEAKAGEAIPVPLNESAIEVLREQLGEHPLYCFSYRGRPLGKSNNTAWRNARQKIGLPRLRVHDLRHSWATWHAMAGTPALALQAMGGWSDARMVRVYTHLAAQHLLDHANAIRVPRHSTGHSAGNEAQPAADQADGFISGINAVDGVADGIRTHNNWNHNPVGATITPIKSVTYVTAGRRKTGGK